MFRTLMSVCLLSVLLVACAGGEQASTTTADAAEVAQVTSEGWRQPSPDGLPTTTGNSANEVGRYLAVVALCNDCHTANWLPAGDVPEEEWLAGVSVGYEGPWGVTFPANLRLRAQEWTEDQWVEILRTRKQRDPMPWIAVNQMSESDSRAFYQFLRNLGPYGEHMPAAIGPDQPITEPYVSLRAWDANTTLQAVPN